MTTKTYSLDELKKNRKFKSDIQKAKKSKIDFSDLPEVSDQEFLTARRGRLPRPEPKEMISIRLYKSTLKILRSTGSGWQTVLSDKIDQWVGEKRSL